MYVKNSWNKKGKPKKVSNLDDLFDLDIGNDLRVLDDNFKTMFKRVDREVLIQKFR